MTAQERILERVEQAQRLGGMYHAEAVGLMAALTMTEPYTYSDEDVLQAGFVRGFGDAKSILHCEENLAQAASSLGTTA